MASDKIPEVLSLESATLQSAAGALQVQKLMLRLFDLAITRIAGPCHQPNGRLLLDRLRSEASHEVLHASQNSRPRITTKHGSLHQPRNESMNYSPMGAGLSLAHDAQPTCR